MVHRISVPSPAVFVLGTALAVAGGVACGSSTDPGTDGSGDGADGGGPDGGRGVALEVVAEGLSNPLHLAAPPGDPRLFVVEQPGRIRIIRDGALLPDPFLDIASRVRSGGERGLLSVAFHPGYAATGRFFVNYTDVGGDTRVEEYTVSADDPDRADPESARLVVGFEQPFSNHNGGLVVFGPDGFLWIGAGDGGSGGDPLGNGQDPGTLLGSLLRIDVDAGDPYGIPPDNPFAGGGAGRPEVWAYGLRNPWRFSFDEAAGVLYVADVGQNRWEEVNAVPAGEAGPNFGWNVMEGLHCFEAASCDDSGLVLPVLEYGHQEADGCSVTGGFVYRGSEVPALRGHYLYSDFCGGWIRSFRLEGGEAVDRTEWDVGPLGSVLSFGEDAAGEAYVLTGEGVVHRFVEGS